MIGPSAGGITGEAEAYDKEIRGHELADVIRQEHAPCLRGRPSGPRHVLRDRGLPDLNPEFQ